jgi:hypothetical protein
MTEQLNWQEYEIEQTGSSNGHCDCCGFKTERVWGFVHHGDITLAAYFVGWTAEKPDHGATFDLVIGKWGDTTSKKDRYSVALDYRFFAQGSSFMVVNSDERTADYSSISSVCLARSDVIGTPLAKQVFTIVDAIYMSSELEEVRAWTSY